MRPACLPNSYRSLTSGDSFVDGNRPGPTQFLPDSYRWA